MKALYILEPYKGPKTRYSCPACNTPRSFVLYVDTNSGEPLSPHIGRCNREDSCGYHLKPRHFFENNHSLTWRKLASFQAAPTAVKQKPIQSSYIPFEVFTNSLRRYESNHLVTWLESLFNSQITRQLIRRFYIGTSKYWPGASVFWQVDRNSLIRTGKVMLYNPHKGKRIKEPFNHIQWVHSILKKKGKLKNFNLCQCFFGEHQLKYDSTKPIAIVESEKTAIVASVYLPEYLWLATGGKNGCKWEADEVNQLLQNRNVTLFPDLNAFEQWRSYSQVLQSKGLQARTSEILERNATDRDRTQGLDIADFLIYRDKEYGWALNEHNYPIFWD